MNINTHTTNNSTIINDKHQYSILNKTDIQKYGWVGTIINIINICLHFIQINYNICGINNNTNK